ncbi:methionine synthase reductase [Drosophila pseudoobscura]|uniref:Methionine synthase reductase n=1 Tax=Drosophila pseudoobscura pseudoobscura TaxID=46245 RepID=A0A6I8UR16_DROPS|nr:methionine synthase reductase [Drosophila pseudoobscura]
MGIEMTDIEAFILNEFIPAKPLDSNLEVDFTLRKQPKSEKCGQRRCGDILKFPFAQTSSTLTAASIKHSQVLVEADKATETKRVVELTLESDDFDYEPGDTIGVLPSNAPAVVEQLLNRLGLIDQADTICQIKLALKCAKKSAKIPAHIPDSTCPREIFTHCLALNGVLQKQFLSALASYTSDAKERGFLACLSSKQATAHYNSLILEQGLRFPDILELCASCQPPLAFLVEHLPRLLPRPYSIANSPLESGTQELRIIYSVLSPKAGVTTSMLEAKCQRQEQSAKVFIYPRLTNTFRYTEKDLCSNQILIAVGTGLAPFLGFLAHKEHHQKQQPAKGQTWLYVGAKTPQAVLKRNKLLAWQQSSVLQRLRMCHSRGESPSYVQQLLEEDAEELVKLLLKPDTVLYICADGAKISTSIASGLCLCLQKVLHLDETEATRQLKELREQGKYREDLWL